MTNEIEIERIAQSIVCATAPFTRTLAGDIWESREKLTEEVRSAYAAPVVGETGHETVGQFVRDMLTRATVLEPDGVRDFLIQISKSGGTVAEAGAEVAASIREKRQ